MPLVGQAIFTEPQRNLMDQRLDDAGLYVATNANGAGFFGDGGMIFYGAEQFINNPILRWTYMSTAVPIADYSSPSFPNGYEPLPGNTTGCPTAFDQSGECIDYVHYAAIISYIWNGRSESATLNGVTQSKDAHAQELAEAVWDVIVTAHNRPELDIADTARWVRNTADGNPHFQAISKFAKFLASYAIIQDQLTGYANYTSNVTSVDAWFAAAADFCYQRANNRINSQFGSGWENFNTNSFNTNASIYSAFNSQSFTHFNSSGVGAPGYEITTHQASGLNNRMMDFVDYVSIYGVHYNDTFYKDFSFNVFRLQMAVGTFSDGTFNEWYRSYDGDPTVGYTYATLTIFKLVAMAHHHAVAVQNGLTGVSNIGLYYDYTSSLGSDELYSSYVGGSTSGGNKGIRLLLDNLSRYYRQSAQGGFLDTRFAEGGNSMDITADYRPYTIMVAMANSYYDDSDLNDYWNMRTSAGYDGMGWDEGGIQQARNAGPYSEHSIGLSWGVSGSVYGGYFGQADMENVTFSSATVDRGDIVGQAIFTQPQLDEMFDRYLNQTPFYNAANGIPGDGAEIVAGAEDFLLEEEAGSFAHEWDWVSSASPLRVEANFGDNSEPRPGRTGSGPGRSIDYDNYAAIMSKVFSGRSNVITFAGQTDTANTHSIRLATAFRDMLLRRIADPDYDFSNTTKYPGNLDFSSNNPFFIMMAKLNKYLMAYALTYDQMPTDTNFASIDTWFTGIVGWADRSLDHIYATTIGERPPFASIPRAIDNAFTRGNYEGGNATTFTHYDSAGNNGVNLIGRLQSQTQNNRTWDFISFMGNYGIHYNDATYRDKNWELFKFYFEVAIFPDGTSSEWYRAMDGFQDSDGLNYVTVVGGHIAHNCQMHAIAVTNGLPGVSDVGQYYDFSTAVGTDELISGYTQTTTSGGSKGPFSYFDNWRRYFLLPVDGGFDGVRFTDSAQQINAYKRPYTGVVSVMNSYYNNPDFTDFENMNTAEGYRYGNAIYPSTYPDGTVIGSAGAWAEPGLGLTWGTLGAMGGNYAQRGMGNIIYSSSTPGPGPGTSVESNNAIVYLQNL